MTSINYVGLSLSYDIAPLLVNHQLLPDICDCWSTVTKSCQSVRSSKMADWLHPDLIVIIQFMFNLLCA